MWCDYTRDSNASWLLPSSSCKNYSSPLGSCLPLLAGRDSSSLVFLIMSSSPVFMVWSLDGFLGDYPSGDHHQLCGAGAGMLQQALSWQGCFPGEIAVIPAALLLMLLLSASAALPANTLSHAFVWLMGRLQAVAWCSQSMVTYSLLLPPGRPALLLLGWNLLTHFPGHCMPVRAALGIKRRVSTVQSGYTDKTFLFPCLFIRNEDLPSAHNTDHRLSSAAGSFSP